MDAVNATRQGRRLVYHVAERSVTINALDASSADLIDRVFAEWHLTPKGENDYCLTGCRIRIRTDSGFAPVPSGSHRFEIADNGVCYSNGSTLYLEIHDCLVVLGLPGLADVEVWINPGRTDDFQELIRVVSYAFSSALRRCGLFELHSAAVVDPTSNQGVLIVGPSGSGKSTLTTQLAASGWPYLSDDVLVIGDRNDEIAAWPVRRCFAVTEQTLSQSQFLQSRVSFSQPGRAEKARFSPHEVFDSGFKESCTPQSLFFTQIAQNEESRISPLSAGQMMSRLLRMSPWSAYDQSTGREHLSALARLIKQCKGFDLFAGRDLLVPGKSASAMASVIQQ
ncbi:MAG TPA: hypothetical protein VNO50_02090 [Pyrinomonadaceae bacterium]|nr:hypothetical protein [Pyrinomonadaceae bacterium]